MNPTQIQLDFPPIAPEHKRLAAEQNPPRHSKVTMRHVARQPDPSDGGRRQPANCVNETTIGL